VSGEGEGIVDPVFVDHEVNILVYNLLLVHRTRRGHCRSSLRGP
jgi:hypothetical protein